MSYFLNGVAGETYGYILGGVIMCLMVGFAAGNYACSLVYRLPRGKPLLEHKPYCGSCNTPLATKDLFPVFSALLLRHKCRYCGAHIPTSHFWTEVLIGLLFVACFLQFNFSDAFILVAGVGVFLIILAAIDANDNRRMTSVIVVAGVFGLVLRALSDQTIFFSFLGGFYGLLIGALLWRKQIRQVNHIYVLPDNAHLLSLAGVIVGNNGLLTALPLTLVLYGVFWLLFKLLGNPRVPLSIPLGLAVMAVLLTPGFSIATLI